jgi:hypothetical protein
LKSAGAENQTGSRSRSPIFSMYSLVLLLRSENENPFLSESSRFQPWHDVSPT